MRKEFNIENSLEKEVVLTIRVPKGFDEDMERRIDAALSDVLYDLGCELVNSGEYRNISVPDLQHVNLDNLKFRDYDDTGMPLQFFFGLEEPKERLQSLASAWGYKGELCKAVTICLDLYSLEECPVEAVLTFEDNDERWVDLRSKNDYLDKLISLVEIAGTERANEALALFNEFKPSLESQIKSASSRANEPSSCMKAVNIEWDVDTDDELEFLPTEISLPRGMKDEDEISDYLSEVTGYCHKGYQLVEDVGRSSNSLIR